MSAEYYSNNRQVRILQLYTLRLFRSTQCPVYGVCTPYKISIYNPF